jgi:hypothetical protein
LRLLGDRCGEFDKLEGIEANKLATWMLTIPQPESRRDNLELFPRRMESRRGSPALVPFWESLSPCIVGWI